jgi:flavin reductase (DIM6/NTAB) family NADH-FMN oxidoreductase RutF
MLFSKSDIAHMDQRYRVHFINSLSGYKSANLIGTQDHNGQTNVSIVSSVFHLGAEPALMGMIVRPHSVPRHTLDNILENQCYTINQVNTNIYQQAHQTSARYPKSVSEFEAVGLTPEYLKGFRAPFVGESVLKIGLNLVEHQTLTVNDTVLVIGEIDLIEVDHRAVQADGFIQLDKLNTVAVSGLDTYYGGHKLNRLSYAEPDQAVKLID